MKEQQFVVNLDYLNKVQAYCEKLCYLPEVYNKYKDEFKPTKLGHVAEQLADISSAIEEINDTFFDGIFRR